jgi:hypothetical protein
MMGGDERLSIFLYTDEDITEEASRGRCIGWDAGDAGVSPAPACVV